jgi:small subunit ribosomal protein S4
LFKNSGSALSFFFSKESFIMSRYRGPRLRITRRLGELPGLARKVSSKQYPPGQHGPTLRGGKASQYSIRLKEKQKLRFNYGVNEDQLVSYVKKARRMKGSTGELLLQLLEMRLDTIVFRGGFAPTLRAARQLVSHGHICVNGSDMRVNIPSYQCKPGDKITVKNKKSSRQAASNESGTNPLGGSHLKFDLKTFSGEVKQILPRSEVGCSVNELLIIEYYSRKV